MKLTAKFAALLIVATFFVSCSSKQKATQTADTTTPATAQATDKKGEKSTAKAATAAATTTTAATTPAVAGTITCKNGSDTRTLSVVAQNSGCEVSYTKFGETTAPASSASGTAHCESVKERIKTNLENAGFQCS